MGNRHDKPAVLKIDAKQIAEDGIKFYLSDNGVWLTDFVDPRYIEKIEIMNQTEIKKHLKSLIDLGKSLETSTLQRGTDGVLL